MTNAFKKILGWGECFAKGDNGLLYGDIVENSASLSEQEGEVQEATVEGGTVEGRKRTPSKYRLEFDRRLGDETDFKPGFTEHAGSIAIVSKAVGATYAQLHGYSLTTSLRQNSQDGLVAHYQYDTMGSTDSAGHLDDIEVTKSTATMTYIEVSATTGKNPYDEGWYVQKEGGLYVHTFDTTPAQGTTYYELTEVSAAG